jgi:hypothetical protein
MNTKVIAAKHLELGSIIINKFDETFTVQSIVHHNGFVYVAGFFRTKRAMLNSSRAYAMSEGVSVVTDE